MAVAASTAMLLRCDDCRRGRGRGRHRRSAAVAVAVSMLDRLRSSHHRRRSGRSLLYDRVSAMPAAVAMELRLLRRRLHE